MDFFFRLFGNVFEGFKPFEDYETGKARYDKYSLMKAIQGYTLYDKNYRATHYPPSSNDRIEHIIKHAVKNNKKWNISVDGSSPLIEAVRTGNVTAIRAILNAWPNDVNQKSWPSGIELTRWAIVQQKPESFRVLLEYNPRNWLYIFLDEISNTLQVELDRNDIDFIIEGEIDMEETEPFDLRSRGELPTAITNVTKLYEVARTKLVERPKWTGEQIRMFYQRFGQSRTGAKLKNEPIPKYMPHVYNELRSIAKGELVAIDHEKC